MNSIAFGEIAPDSTPRAASTASRVKRLHGSLLKPLARLTGLKLWMRAEDAEEGEASAEPLLCRSSQCQFISEGACREMLRVLRREASTAREPRYTSCGAGFRVFSVPIPSEKTSSCEYIEGRTPGQISDDPCEAAEPSPLLAPAIELITGIAQSLAQEPRPIPPTAPEETGAVQQAKLYIKENLTGKLALSDIARAVDLSEGYLSKLFRQEEGISVGHYLIRERIAYSCEQLVSTRKNVSEIAYAAGFESISHFNRTFKAHTQASPKRYRAIHRAQPAPER
ncbi:MAG: helix-turn-helix domain-containing protein [Chthoniobacteraceae bacterium]